MPEPPDTVAFGEGNPGLRSHLVKVAHGSPGQRAQPGKQALLQEYRQVPGRISPLNQFPITQIQTRW